MSLAIHSALSNAAAISGFPAAIPSPNPMRTRMTLGSHYALGFPKIRLRAELVSDNISMMRTFRRIHRYGCSPAQAGSRDAFRASFIKSLIYGLRHDGVSHDLRSVEVGFGDVHEITRQLVRFGIDTVAVEKNPDKLRDMEADSTGWRGRGELSVLSDSSYNEMLDQNSHQFHMMFLNMSDPFHGADEIMRMIDKV
ncbi:MAG: hypothetical protein HN337_04620 [Deltaproteobacteria bacterium]|jgi:hypothetical protein|nr:hypothetical protein [Deltaproteobacteria bacterium]